MNRSNQGVPSSTLSTVTTPVSAAPAPVIPADYTARLIPDIPHVHVELEITVPAWDKGELGSYLEFDENRMIVFLHADAEFATSKLIVGDRVYKLNDKTDLVPKDLEDNFHVEGKLNLVLIRRRYCSPVAPQRAEQIKLLPCYGFGYSMLTVTKLPNDDLNKRQVFGFSGRTNNNKIYVCTVQPNTPAAEFFCVGDALIDLNGTSIPFNQSYNFVNNYLKEYKTAGKFTCVLERPSQPEQLDSVNALISSFFPPPQPERGMQIDAANIGAEAARNHATLLRKLQPKPILRQPTDKPAAVPMRTIMSAPTPTRERKTTTRKSRGKNRDKEDRTIEKTVEDGEEAATGHQTVIQLSGAKGIEYSIGTDVPEDKKLRKVEKKSKVRKGQGFLNSFFDMF